MMRSITTIAVAGAFALAASPSAAATCDVGPDRGPDTSDPCLGICGYNATANTYNCDLSNNAETVDPWAVAIYDPDSDYCASGDVFCLWGVEGDGDDFYCGTDTHSGAMVGLRLVGTKNDDRLYFQYEQYDFLQEHTTSAFTGYMEGGDGIDQLIGSERDSAYYTDDLSGDAAADEICGYAGDDVLRGGDGADIILGGDDDDTIYGNPGEDDLCGQGGADDLRGGTDADVLWSGSDAGDAEDGQGGNDLCELAGTPSATSCVTTPTPTSCPY